MVIEPSEISTSTEDYVTATDSASYTTTTTQGPSVTSSSFDSESSKYSLPHPIFDHDVSVSQNLKQDCYNMYNIKHNILYYNNVNTDFQKFTEHT